METLNQLTDEELVGLYSKGDNDAFDVLLLRYKRKVFSYISLSVKNRDLANDLFQETFIKAIMTIKQGKYTEKGKFGSWIIKIAHNLIIDCFRREQSENIINEAESDVDIFSNIKLYDTNAEDLIVKEQVYVDLVKLVDYLPDNQKEVLKMRFFEDLSFKEIADTTGVSINTALGRMRYAILNMRKLAESKDVSPVFCE